MKKLNLDIDALVVESFEALPPQRNGRGTVRGHEPAVLSADGTCVPFTDPDGGCALSDDDGTCFISQCGQPGCTGPSNDLVVCFP